MNNSELASKCQGLAQGISYNDEKEAPIKHTLQEVAHRLDATFCTITKKKDGYMMRNSRGRTRFLNFWETVIWLTLKLPPYGMQIKDRPVRW